MDYFAYFMIAAFAFTGGAVGFFAARYCAKGVQVGIWAVFLAFSAAMAGLMNTTPGWDAITYAVILFGACAPTGLGLTIGSAVGWFKRKRIAGA